jgi:uncharacterized protein
VSGAEERRISGVAFSLRKCPVAAVVVVLVVLVAHNVLGNLVLPSALYVPANLATAAVLLGLARASGISRAELGLSGSTMTRGAAVGAAAFLVVTTILVVAALVPTTRPLFQDERAAGITGAALAYQALIRIPLGTVVLEEIAFRGVLLAMLNRVTSSGTAVAGSSAAFGLWHVLPTVEALRANDLPLSAPAIIAAVGATAIAGIAFCWLRLHSGSLIAPALAHIATNSVALVAAVAVLRTNSALWP